jgi:predicted nucleic acid-binding protein
VTEVFVIDASVLISALSPQERDQADSRRFLETLQSPGCLVVLPALVRAEVAGAIARLTGNEEASIRAARLKFVPAPLMFVNVDEILVEEALEMAAAC